MLDDFYNKIKVLEEFDIVKETIDILNENDEYIADLVRNQLMKGKRGDGEDTEASEGAFYKSPTVERKLRLDGLSGEYAFVTMFDSGNFYKSLQSYAQGVTFEVDSDVPYFDKLQQWNNGKLVELTQQNCDKFAQEILFPELQKRFSSYWNGV